MNSSTKHQTRLRHLKRLRWWVFAAVALGILASVATNVLHARPELIPRAIAAWPPLALFGGIELISRIPSSNRWLSAGRIIGALLVGVVAGSISYVHMVGTVELYGETGWRAAIWPISVDGLMIVATLSLVEVVAKIRQLETMLEDAAEAMNVVRAPIVVPVPHVVRPPVVVAVPQPPAAVIPKPVVIPPLPVVPAPVVAQAEEITRQAAVAQSAPMSPALAVEAMRTDPYWGARLRASRPKPATKA